MATLSSGTARAPNHPQYVAPQSGPAAGQQGSYVAGTVVPLPAGFAAANGGVLPNVPGCGPCVGATCSVVYDSIRLRVRIRVPTNAQSLTYRLKYYSSEYPESVCSSSNDAFVTLLHSQWVPSGGARAIPADRNIAIDEEGSPLTVNTRAFTVCFPPPGAPGLCPSGTLELIGTGMGGWNNALTDGGGTEWLVNEAPVVPGEIITLDFIIWDTSDGLQDALIQLDDFRFLARAGTLRLGN